MTLEILRKVYYKKKYEGVYKLVFEDTYKWRYYLVDDDESDIDYPKLSLGPDRNISRTIGDEILGYYLKFKEEDLLSS